MKNRIFEKLIIPPSHKARDLIAAIVFYTAAIHAAAGSRLTDPLPEALFSVLSVSYWIFFHGAVKSLKLWRVPFSLLLIPNWIVSELFVVKKANKCFEIILVSWIAFEFVLKFFRQSAEQARKECKALKQPVILLTPAELKKTAGLAAPKKNVTSACIRLNRVFEESGVSAEAVEYVDGPASGTYFIKLHGRESVRRIETNLKDIQLRLGTGALRTGMTGGFVTLEFTKPAGDRRSASIREVFMNQAFKASKRSIAIGRDTSGRDFFVEAGKLPHLLIAGKSGSGKSVLIRSVIASLALKNSPEELILILCDGKGTELAEFGCLPQLISGIAVTQEDIEKFVQRAYEEMRRRQTGGGAAQALVAIVIDEADIVLSGGTKKFRDNIIEIAKLGRSLGFFLVLASQRPDKRTIDGGIQANFSKIALQAADKNESVRIINEPGAEKLPGDGAMYFVWNNARHLLQGYYISEKEAGLFSRKINEKYARSRPAAGSFIKPPSPADLISEPNKSRPEPNKLFIEPNKPLYEPHELWLEPNKLRLEPNEPMIEPGEPDTEPGEFNEPGEPHEIKLLEAKVIELSRQGCSERQVAAKAGISRSKVHRILAEETSSRRTQI